MTVIKRPEDAPPLFGGAGRAQIIFGGPALIAQMREWQRRRRDEASSTAEKDPD